MRVFLLDNYDSFTYNLYHLLAAFSENILVARNDEIRIETIKRYQPHLIVLSPGPKNPGQAGMTKEVIRYFAGRLPLFGVCLGMQAINEVYGGRTVHAADPVHGKTSPIYHTGDEMFRGIPSPFHAARYHSLRVEIVPGDIIPVAHTEDGIVMAIRHRTMPVCGVQYHPESFMSEYGKTLVENIIAQNAE